MSFNQWKELKLEELCISITDGSHSSPKSVEKGYPMASVKDMNYFEINLDTCRKISEEDYSKLVKARCKPEKNDILIAKDGSYLKHVHIVKEEKEVVILSSIAILKPNIQKIYPEFLRYYLLSPMAKANLEAGYVSGSAIRRIVLKDFKRFPIYVPTLEEQKAIANTLSSLDEKIELNNQMNETLEEMAQALFKRWFVDFEFPNEEGKPYKSSGGEMVESELGMIPKGWNIEQIGKISEIQNGFAFRADEYVGQGIPVLRTLNIKDGIFENTNIVFLPEEYKDSKYRKYIFEKFDCALVMVGAGIGKIGLILDNTKGGLQNQNMWRFRSLNNAIPQLYLNFLVKQARDKSKNWGNGSAREFYRKDSFSKINVLVANYTLLKQFNELILPLYNKISENVVENEVLIQLRDSLLPKLMSGEIRVSDLN